MKLFNRPVPDDHPFALAQSVLLASEFWDDRSMGRNIMHDWRVTPAREQRLNETAIVRTSTDLEVLVQKYYEQRVRKEADYLDESVNADNILTGRSDRTPEVPGEFLLARLLDVTGLHRVLRAESERGRRGFEDYPRYAVQDSDEAVRIWLEQRLDPKAGGSDSVAAEFVSLVLHVLNERMDENYPCPPAWAVPWREFAPLINDRASRWIEVLGIGRTAEAGRWVIILRYSVRDAGTLVRPTMLDAGWYAWHFPSPPPHVAPLERGGYCVDLRTSRLPDQLTREYIHQQTRYAIRYFTDAGCIRGKSTLPVGGAPLLQRVNHHRLLAKWYGSGIADWMPEPA